MGKCVSWLQEDRKFYISAIVITMITNVLMLITFQYVDLVSLSAWTLDFWDMFFQGRLEDYYEYILLQAHGSHHINGGALWLIPWNIWNLPLWIVYQITGITTVSNFWSLCWSKLFLFVLTFVMADYVKRICTLFIDNKKTLLIAWLLILSSPELLISVGYAGQDEIVYLCFFIMGLYYYLNENYKRSYFLFMCAVSLCPIMLLVVLPLFIFKEKGIIKLLVLTGGTFIPLILFELFYYNNAAYYAAKRMNKLSGTIFYMLNGSVIGEDSSVFSGIGVILIFIYFIVYQMDKVKCIDDKRVILYVEAVIFVLISFGMPEIYYRLFLYSPILIILLMISKQKENIKFFLFMILTYGRSLVVCSTNASHNMNTYYIMKNSWISNLCEIVGSNKYMEEMAVSLYNNNRIPIETMDMLKIIAATCAVASVIILLVINYPLNKKEYSIEFASKYSMGLTFMAMPGMLVLFYIMLLK